MYKKDIFYRMVYHLNRKSIADCLLKYFFQEASELCSDMTQNFEVEVKNYLFEKILESFNLADEERCINICDFFVEGLSSAPNCSRRFLHLILKNENLIRKIFSLCFNNLNTSVGKELLKILTKFTEAILKEIKIKLKESNGIIEGN